MESLTNTANRFRRSRPETEEKYESRPPVAHTLSQPVVLNRFKSLEKLGVGGDEAAHRHKGSHNADVHLDSRL